MTTDLEPTQAELDRFIVGAGFTWGWENMEPAARQMARHAVRQNRHHSTQVFINGTLAHARELVGDKREW